MKQKCKNCGMCCTAIVYQAGIEAFNMTLKQVASRDRKLINEHWHRISKEKALELNPKLKDWFLDTAIFFQCDLLSDDNKCKMHSNRPLVCEGYPLYGILRGDESSLLWYSDSCSYRIINK